MEVDKSCAALTSGGTPLPLLRGRSGTYISRCAYKRRDAASPFAGRRRICLSVDGKHLKVDSGFELDHSKKPRCPNAVVGRSMPRSGVE